MAWKFAFDKHNRNRNGYSVILSSLKLVLHIRVSGQKLTPKVEESPVQNAVCEYKSLGSFPFPPGYGVVVCTLPFNVFVISFQQTVGAFWCFTRVHPYLLPAQRPARLGRLLLGRTRGGCARLAWRPPVTGMLPQLRHASCLG